MYMTIPYRTKGTVPVNATPSSATRPWFSGVRFNSTRRSFNGSTQANSPSAYTSTNFRNSAWTGHLGEYEPDPEDAANDLHHTATLRANAQSAGIPANLFVVNPAVDEANITKSLAGTRYHSGQVELRRRFANGFLVNANWPSGLPLCKL